MTTTGTWRGKDLNDMSKDELIQAIIELGMYYDTQIKNLRSELNKLKGDKPHPFESVYDPSPEGRISN